MKKCFPKEQVDNITEDTKQHEDSKESFLFAYPPGSCFTNQIRFLFFSVQIVFKI